MKTALVTGAGKGIGLEICKQLANNGVQVFAISRNTNALQNLPNITPIAFNLTEFNTYNFLIETISLKTNSLDILIHNAGVLFNNPIEETDFETIDIQFKTNIYAPILLSKALLPLLKKSDSANIINIGSMGGFQGSSKFAGLSIYSATKGALATFSECLAEELKPFNIRVNTLALGAVQTEMREQAFPNYKSKISATEMGNFICNFALTNYKFFNSKIIPVSSSIP